MSYFLIVRTTTEEFSFNPDAVLAEFSMEWAAWEGTRDDFFLAMFERHDGSQFGDELFSDNTNYDVGLEVVERGDDE